MTEQEKTLLRVFCGWLTTDIPELRHVEIPVISESLDRFVEKMDDALATTTHVIEHD